MTQVITPHNGMLITHDITLAAGVHVLPDGIRIEGNDITVRGEGAHIVSPEQAGVGIYAHGDNITIGGVNVNGFYHGVRADDCTNLTLETLTIRNTYELPGIDSFLYLWQPLDQAYGGAVLLSNVRGGVVQTCDLQHQMNGVQLYGCERIVVSDVNASFNSGWGVYLSASHECMVARNQLDFCNRLFRRDDGSIRVEADAAGIVLVNGSSRSRFIGNSCLCGGDGIFIAGYRHPGDVQPCNDNLFEDNDCRLSPNNAIESTFSRGNIFRRNDCSRSNYGFWMGFSWDNVIEDNTIEFNRWAGIAAEHAHDFTIRNNRIRLNGDGVRVWTRGGAVMPYWQGFEVSYNFTLENNLIESNTVGFTGYTGAETTEQQCHNLHLRGNTFTDNRVGAQFQRVQTSTLHENTFADHLVAAVRLEGTPDVAVDDNQYTNNTHNVVTA